MTQDDGGYDLKPQPEKPSEIAPVAPLSTSESNRSGSAGEGVAALGASPKPGEPGWVPPVPVIEPADAEEGEDPDVETHKGVAVLAYILFLIPLVVAPNSKFARYHANQGLLLFILLFVVTVGVAILQVGKIITASLLVKIPILDWFFSCGMSLLQPALLIGWVALMVVGILNAANGICKPLPGVGHWNLLK